MLKYAGIGSRTAPNNILIEMLDIAKELASRRWLLRSGGAQGSDSAFETGCDLNHGKKEIFLPWKGFNGSLSSLYTPSEEAKSMALKIHPSPDYLNHASLLLHARNCHQILDQTLKDAVDLVICWTPNGQMLGGTATAIQIAMNNNIPIINLTSTKYNNKIISDIESKNIDKFIGEF